MKKHIANIITGSRIVFSFPLLFIPLSSAWFYALYLLLGFTDMIDGAMARKTGAVSEFGARLDTVSDLVFVLICCVRILSILHMAVWLWAWIALIALTKILNITVVLIRKKKLISIHSVLNKITGFTLFLLPLTLNVIEHTYSISAMCVLATGAVMQEVYFIAKGKEVL